MTTESNAERLERIAAYQKHGFPLPNADFDWLIRQTELSEKRNERYRVWYEGAKKAMAEREVFRQENARLREAINRSLKAHRWNNEESARILEEALAGETNGQRKS